jgi:hypothetical protein
MSPLINATYFEASNSSNIVRMKCGVENDPDFLYSSKYVNS